MAYSSQAGGFLSPPASSTASSSLRGAANLPHPRSSPLRSGGAKESAFIRYTDSQLLHIQRRFAKRTTPTGNGLSSIAREEADTWGDVQGYKSMTEACKELKELVDVVWVSGTPSLQVPYLINIGMLVGNIVAGMPPSPRGLFKLLGILDRAFSSLLQGRDVETGETLSGFQSGRAVSGTEKVRIRSLVERTRVAVVEAFKRGEFQFDDAQETDETEENLEGELVLEGSDVDMDNDDDSWDMQLARVYDLTIVELGDSLGEPDIGVITEIRR